MTALKALTVWQPWATFIADGVKRFETRHWSTVYRGNLAIHAAKRWTDEERDVLDWLCDEYPMELGDYQFKPLPLGFIVATVRLVAVHHVEDVIGKLADLEVSLGDFSSGRFAWELEVVKLPSEAIRVRGQQGLWNWIPERDLK